MLTLTVFWSRSFSLMFVVVVVCFFLLLKLPKFFSLPTVNLRMKIIIHLMSWVVWGRNVMDMLFV